MPARIKIILDTNWYISATVNKKSRRKIYNLITNKSLTCLYSEELLSEYIAVIQRDKFKNMVNRQQVDRFLILALSELKRIKITQAISKSRDPKDNYLLAMAMDGKADYLITGDIHLLELKAIGSTKIITLAEFDIIFASTLKPKL